MISKNLDYEGLSERFFLWGWFFEKILKRAHEYIILYTAIFVVELVFKCFALVYLGLYIWLNDGNSNIYILIHTFCYLFGALNKMVVLFDRFNLPSDIFEVIFATKQQKIVAKELVKYMVDNNGEITKTEMSMFATLLHDGKYEAVLDEEPYKNKKVKLSYNKRQFYDRILTPMKSMGLIDYDLYKKTYKLSIKFKNDMMKIGLMWDKELRRLGVNL